MTYCSVCDEKIDAHEHIFFTIDTATCTSGGQLTDQCRYCFYETDPTDTNGNVYQSFTNAKGHDLVTEKVDATCVSDGYEGIVCKNCDYAETTVIASEGHKFADGVCGVCGEADPDYSEEPDYIIGDFNGDTNINAIDLNIAKRILSGAVTATKEQVLAGDANGDGIFNGIDSNLISRFVAGTIDKFE